MMTKFNVGDKVRITHKSESIPYGTVVTVKSGPGGSHSGGNYTFVERVGCVLGNHLELVVEQPKKSARITALEKQVAALEAKVEALEKAGKYPLTAKFNRESPEVDAIMTDIKRKASE